MDDSRIKKNCIRKWRVYRGLTRAELAKKAGFSNSTLTLMELQKIKKFNIQKFNKIAKVLKVDVKQLIESEETNND